MQRRVVGAGLLVVGVALGGLALADDGNEPKRRELISEIDKAIENTGNELAGFEGDSDDGDLRDALSYISQVDSLVGKLREYKGSDSRANRIVDYYPRLISDFRQAAQYLGRLKQGQRHADGAADKCRNDESNLQTLIRYYVGKPDEAEEAFAKLPEKAKEYQRTWQPQLEAWKRNDGEMANAASYARFGTSEDNGWSRVSSNLTTALNAMHSYWRERYAAAERECPRLALGEKHPDVDRALDDLRKYTGTIKETVTQLKKDYNAWLREVRKLREFSTQDRDAIREAICRSGEYEMERRVLEVADRWASQIASAHGTALGQADRLRSRAEDSKLKKYKGGQWVLEGLRRNVENLDKLKRYELLGSNNPKIRTKLEWGKKRHEDLQSGCTYSELKISSTHCRNEIRPGSGCRADCVKVSSGTCTVIEIKPDSEGGKREGRTQADAYELGLLEWYRRDKASMFKEYPNLSSCESSDKTSFSVRSEVITYELCSSIVRDEFGEQLPEPSADLSENAE